VIVPPLSLRGTAISIRKFSEKPITIDMLRAFGSMSEQDGHRAENRRRLPDEHRHLRRYRFG
jgi:type IV secretory pathway ATPase VirB11/archaellum biosynthesis ATPase